MESKRLNQPSVSLLVVVLLAITGFIGVAVSFPECIPAIGPPHCLYSFAPLNALVII
jgi:hypothetical protein